MAGRTAEIHPGTVSKILWHFTGGPRWDEDRQRQRIRPKPEKDAYRALQLILASQTILLGQYREIVKATYHVRITNPRTKEIRRKPRELVFKSAPVCCLADIPIAHLSYHAQRYGKFAIGFHRGAVVRHKFSPVFYALNDSQPIQSLRRCLTVLEEINQDARSESFEAGAVVRDATAEDIYDIDDFGSALSNFESAFDSIGEKAADAKGYLHASLPFVKTFSQSEFSTVYCEREWRSTREFGFQLDEVAMIVLPKQGNDRSFFEEFLKLTKPKLPRSIPIVPWEDLVEYQD